ncbi:MAG TPA: cysteine--tRNA ligase [Nevskiaceae bacterium]|nr:cysteine--tRNA ligase [Nevskiaceae bacterium]
MIKLYNTLTKKIEEFKPIEQGKVDIYSCGPTVYWYQHIGHMYAYIHWDTLVRFLRYSGFKVKWVMNITDVGHMVSDEDTGEDKMEKGARREGLTVWEIAGKYIDQFLESLEFLNIQKPDVLPRATKHIQVQIDLIKRIEKNGFTYKTKTGLVFDTTKFSGYADFAKLDLKKQISGSRVEIDPEKKRPWDFLLWVTNQPKHIMQWDSPWGKGFPGWHIECTAMSTKYLGEQFDIHTGGLEHIPVHHTNEIAQAYGAFGKKLANYWLHNAWLTLKNEKMSKSLGNMILVTDLIKRGFEPMHFRYLVLTSHYHKGLVFDWKALKAARVAYQRLVQMIKEWKEEEEKSATQERMTKTEKFRQKFLEKISNDLNYPEALAVVWEMAKSNIPSPDKLDLILDFDQVLGLGLAKQSKTKLEIPKDVQELVEKREKLRKQNKWQEADEVRQQIAKLGWKLEDTNRGSKIKPV